MIEEVLTKLCRIWASNSEIPVLFSEEGHYRTQFKETGEPSAVMTSTKNKGVDPATFESYRLSRFGTWHESMHVKHESPKHIRLLNQYKLDKSACNILRDYHIEEEGLKTYVGYRSEKRFAYEASEHLLLNLNKANSDFSKSMFANNTQAYMDQSKEHMITMASHHTNMMLQFNETKIEFPLELDAFRQPIQNILDSYKQRLFQIPAGNTRDTFIQDKCVELSNIFNQMRDKLDMDKGQSSEDGNTGDNMLEQAMKSGAQTQQDKKELKKISDKNKSSQSVKDEFNESMGKGNSESNIDDDEDAQHEAKLLMHDTNVRVTRPGTDPISYLEAFNRGVGQLSRLKMTIKQLKREYTEVLQDDGDELDIDLYLCGEQDYFISERKDKPLNDVLIVVDVSGSTMGEFDNYQTTTSLIYESLSALGIRFGIYAFDETNEPNLYMVKAKGESNRARITGYIGGMASGGRTPMASIMKAVNNVSDRYKHVIVLTDGYATDSFPQCKAQFVNLHSKGVDVFMVGYESTPGQSSMKQYFQDILHPRQFPHSRTIANVGDFPQTVLRIVGGR